VKKRLVLATNSPRRIELLKSLNYCFEVIPHWVEENKVKQVLSSPAEFVQHLAYLKARDVGKRVREAIIIGADTIVSLDNKILGKPSGKNDAKRMLLSLSGVEHNVFSGICIKDMYSGKEFVDFDQTHVKMKNISNFQVEMYLKSGEPMDKAGAYSIQGEGKRFVESIEGSYTNVIGMPLELLQKMLYKL